MNKYYFQGNNRKTMQLKNIKISQEANTAILACLEAGQAIMDIYTAGNFEIEQKEDRSPVTKADKAAHEIIYKILQQTSIPILSEEGRTIPYLERKQWKQVWIVDPIDGTKEFIKRNGEFTVNIALIECGAPIIGVIYVPAQKVLYFACEEMGSYKISNIGTAEEFIKKEGSVEKLPITYPKKNYTVVASKSHFSEETSAFISSLKKNHGEIDILSTGSSLKLCLVAEGRADCYPRFAPTMEWDIAAGHAICQFAGVHVIDVITKTNMCYNRENLVNNWFIAK